tara:strand:- start:63 stop:485 length:423 start_codon:yes stop_codon:yes gene_type:complete
LTNGRQIGAAFERNVAALLKEELGYNFKRDLEQYRASCHGDLICDEINFPFVIECKRRASGKTYSLEWWQQSKTAANASHKIPVLIYQLIRSPIKCVIDMNTILDVFGGHQLLHEYLVEISLPTFCMIAREMLNVHPMKS